MELQSAAWGHMQPTAGEPEPEPVATLENNSLVHCVWLALSDYHSMHHRSCGLAARPEHESGSHTVCSTFYTPSTQIKFARLSSRSPFYAIPAIKLRRVTRVRWRK